MSGFSGNITVFQGHPQKLTQYARSFQLLKTALKTAPPLSAPNPRNPHNPCSLSSGSNLWRLVQLR
jgi:hypothetical protein